MNRFMQNNVNFTKMRSKYSDYLKERLNAVCCENVLASNYQTKPMVTNPAENSEVGLNQVGVEWTGRLTTETAIIYLHCSGQPIQTHCQPT